MGKIVCVGCGGKAAVKRPKSGEPICRVCFYKVLEDEVHETITKYGLFKRGEKVAIAASGGKDSTVLAELLTLLNKRHDYGLDLCLLSVDEGISGYRDDSLETVKLNQQSYEIPLLVVSYEELYGWSMDKIVATIGRKSNCTFCGVFRRQALERGANLLKVDKIVTGHNADDVAETIIMNLLRGDAARLRRCVEIETKTGQGGIPRVRPFKYTYEKEIVLYAHFKRLDYFSTECSYAPGSFRGYARTYLKELERVKPTVILDVIHSGEKISFTQTTRMPKMRSCSRCGFLSSMELCKACVLLDTLHQKRAKKMELEMEENGEGEEEGKGKKEGEEGDRKRKREEEGCGEGGGDDGEGCGGESRICGCAGGKKEGGGNKKELLASFNDLMGGLLQEQEKK